MAYLTDEERKAPLTRIINGCVFDTCVDLSTGIKVYPVSESIRDDLVVQAKILFTAWWCITIHKQLNGFPGFDTVKWIDLTENPNLPQCNINCIHHKFLNFGGPSGDYIGECLHDRSIKNHWNSKCFCSTEYKLKCDGNETK